LVCFSFIVVTGDRPSAFYLSLSLAIGHLLFNSLMLLAIGHSLFNNLMLLAIGHSLFNSLTLMCEPSVHFVNLVFEQV